jgi:Core-2/I-Branching enzyme
MGARFLGNGGQLGFAFPPSISRIAEGVLWGQWDRHPHRWVWKMKNAYFDEHHWRKSSQWWALSREHAETIVEDVLIDQSFRKYCYSTIEEGW